MPATTFDEAVTLSRTLPAPQPPEVLLALYGLFKQATEGDVSGGRPGAFDFKGRAKWDAWAAHRGLGTDAAKAAYVAFVNQHLEAAKR
ncbi:MAG: acyl-CoA-binding protein [Deltaproteobacteria bacterium]|nr:acyl-CoA-binding protein [Deltaproteobacteria bacterium]